MIIDDAQTDAAKPVPFTPLGVGTIHGEMLAMISTLALILKQILEELHADTWLISPRPAPARSSLNDSLVDEGRS